MPTFQDFKKKGTLGALLPNRFPDGGPLAQMFGQGGQNAPPPGAPGSPVRQPNSRSFGEPVLPITQPPATGFSLGRTGPANRIPTQTFGDRRPQASRSVTPGGSLSSPDPPSNAEILSDLDQDAADKANLYTTGGQGYLEGFSPDFVFGESPLSEGTIGGLLETIENPDILTPQQTEMLRQASADKILRESAAKQMAIREDHARRGIAGSGLSAQLQQQGSVNVGARIAEENRSATLETALGRANNLAQALSTAAGLTGIETDAGMAANNIGLTIVRDIGFLEASKLVPNKADRVAFQQMGEEIQEMFAAATNEGEAQAARDLWDNLLAAVGNAVGSHLFNQFGGGNAPISIFNSAK